MDRPRGGRRFKGGPCVVSASSFSSVVDAEPPDGSCRPQHRCPNRVGDGRRCSTNIRRAYVGSRHDVHQVSQASVLRTLRERRPDTNQRERRKPAEKLKAAFAATPTGPNQVW